MPTLDFLRQNFDNDERYLGDYSTAEITAINTAIATGGFRPRPGTTLVNKDVGQMLTLSGIGAAASFIAVSGDGNFETCFSDSFRRPDTALGTIAGGWVAKGPYVASYPLPAATSGKITSQGVEEPNGTTTYWMRALPAIPKTIQVRQSFLDLANGNTGFQTFCLICTNSAANLIDNMGLHLTLQHTTLKIQERILATGGAFVDLVPPVDLQPRLSLADGENIITVTLDAANNTGVVRVNQFMIPFSSTNLGANIGSTIGFEHFNTAGGAPLRWRGRVLEVSAAW